MGRIETTTHLNNYGEFVPYRTSCQSRNYSRTRPGCARSRAFVIAITIGFRVRSLESFLAGRSALVGLRRSTVATLPPALGRSDQATPQQCSGHACVSGRNLPLRRSCWVCCLWSLRGRSCCLARASFAEAHRRARFGLETLARPFSRASAGGKKTRPPSRSS